MGCGTGEGASEEGAKNVGRREDRRGVEFRDEGIAKDLYGKQMME